MARYSHNVNADVDYPTFGRYKPFRGLFRYEAWTYKGYRYDDWTNRTTWNFYYYPRNHKNIPNDENIYTFFTLCYGGGTETLWALTDQ